MKFEWKTISSYSEQYERRWTMRAKVFGGWIVQSGYEHKACDETAHSVSISNVFIPDPDHEWETESE